MSECTECDEYNKEKFYCPKWCEVIKGTIEDVRADERRKFAEFLEENNILARWDGNDDLVCNEVLSADNILLMYEKEQEQ